MVPAHHFPGQTGAPHRFVLLRYSGQVRVRHRLATILLSLWPTSIFFGCIAAIQSLGAHPPVKNFERMTPQNQRYRGLELCTFPD